MSEINLLPCPFCGYKASITNVESPASGRFMWVVGCDSEDCGVDFPGHARKIMAANDWNKRTALPQPERVYSWEEQYFLDQFKLPAIGGVDECVRDTDENIIGEPQLEGNSTLRECQMATEVIAIAINRYFSLKNDPEQYADRDKLTAENERLTDAFARIKEGYEHAFPDRPWGASPNYQRTLMLLNELTAENERLRAALQNIEPESKKALAIIEREGFIFDGSGDRWEKLAFTLYSALVMASVWARQSLEEEDALRSPTDPQLHRCRRR